MKHKDAFNLSDVTNCLEVGFMLNLERSVVPDDGAGKNEFSLATPIAEYLGVLQTRCDKYSYLNADGRQ